jgi:hypothetical protein
VKSGGELSGRRGGLWDSCLRGEMDGCCGRSVFGSLVDNCSTAGAVQEQITIYAAPHCSEEYTTSLHFGRTATLI